MTEYEMPKQYGWICPRCGQVNAPWMSVCTCSEQNNVTYSDRTDYKAERKEE